MKEDNIEEDLKNYYELRKEYDSLQDGDGETAFKLEKKAVAQYDRWSEILFQTRKDETRGVPKNPPLKDRMSQILTVIGDIKIMCRMNWAKSKDDLRKGMY